MSPIKQRSPRRTAAQWHQIVEAQQASGLSAPKFCDERAISYPSFMNWKKKLSNTSSKPDEKLPTFIELTAPSDSATPDTGDSTVKPVRIELDLGCGTHLRISRAG